MTEENENVEEKEIKQPTPMLNKFARQQRLNPKYADPATRSMMDAVAQVYVGKEENAE